jgi:hypothetical protein
LLVFTIGAGWLVRKLLPFNSNNIFKKILGFGLQAIATKVVANKMPAIREKIS